MAKVYFDSDDNVRVEGKPETEVFCQQSLQVFPDGRCFFKGERADGLPELHKLKPGTPEYEDARKRWGEWIRSSRPEMTAPDEAAVFWFSVDSIGHYGKMTQDDRRHFFEVNKNLLQKIVDEGIVPRSQRKTDRWGPYDHGVCCTEAGEDASNSVGSHAGNFDPRDVYKIWYERFPGEHLCGLTQEDFLAFAEANNIRCDVDEAERNLCVLDKLMGAKSEIQKEFDAVLGDGLPPPVERVGLTADKSQIFVQLRKPVYEEHSLGDDYGEKKVDRYGKYSCMEFLTKLLPSLGETAYSLNRLPELKDPSCGIPGISFNDLKCRPFRPLFDTRDSCAVQVAKMLRCFEGTDILYDFMKEFPKEAFPDFPDRPLEKDDEVAAFQRELEAVVGSSLEQIGLDQSRDDKDSDLGIFKPDESCWFWHSNEAREAREKLAGMLEKCAPKGIMFASLAKNPKLAGHRMAELDYGFWDAMDYGETALDFFYDQVASGNHPAFRGSEPGKDGKVRVFVPRTHYSDGVRIQPLERFYAAGQCAVFDPDKDRGPRDYWLQVNPLLNDVSECVKVPVIGTNPVTKEKDDLSLCRVNFISVLPDKEKRKVVLAMSSDPVDYIARFNLASRTGCDLSTTKEVMNGARKKLAGWLGKHFCAGEYDKLVALNKKIERREKEIVAEMKEKKEQKKAPGVSHDKSVETELSGGGYEL